MAIKTIKVLVPAPVDMPRGAAWAAAAAVWIAVRVRRLSGRRAPQPVAPRKRRARLRPQPCGQ
jgi:hypothetical protein